MIINAMTDIAIASVVLVIVSQLLQNKFVDKNKMNEHKKQMKEKQARMKELIKKDDEKSKKELQKIQQEIMEMTTHMMQGSMRYMMFSMPLFLVVFWILGSVYKEAIINLPFAVPWVDGIWHTQTNWLGWYVLCSIIASIIIKIGVNIIKKVGKNA